MKIYEVIVVGGSYAGSSVGLTLGRAMRKVLIIDAGKPANRFAPIAHNLLGHDGENPGDILVQGRKDLKKYPHVQVMNDSVIDIVKDNTNDYFTVSTKRKERYKAKKIFFASGLKDHLPEIEGFSECWGKSIIHCPYCDGYEYKNNKTGLIVQSKSDIDMIPTLYNWSQNLSIILAPEIKLDIEVQEDLQSHNIRIIQGKIVKIQHEDGFKPSLEFENIGIENFDFLYMKPKNSLSDSLASKLGCKLTEQGRIWIDENHRTSIAGAYAAGDNSYTGRSLAQAIAQGSSAGMTVNGDLLREEYEEFNSKINIHES